MNRLLIIVLIGFPLISQSPPDEKTGPYLNGRFWNNCSDTLKLGFVMGFGEAVGYCDGDAVPCLQFGELRHGLDRFYDAPENLPINIRVAMHLLAKKTSGMEPVAYERELALSRAAAKNAPPLK